MAKREISWKRRTESGERQEMYVRHVAGEWIFYARAGRYEQWRILDDPPLADWMELLDAVSRRTVRQLLRPEEEAYLKKIIRERFPDAALPT